MKSKLLLLLSGFLFALGTIAHADGTAKIKEKLAGLTYITHASAYGKEFDLRRSLETESQQQFVLFISTPVLTDGIKTLREELTSSDFLLYTGGFRTALVQWHSLRVNQKGQFMAEEEDVLWRDQINELGALSEEDYQGGCVLVQMWSFGEIQNSACVAMDDTMDGLAATIQREHYRDAARRMRSPQYQQGWDQLQLIVNGKSEGKGLPDVFRVLAALVLENRDAVTFLDGRMHQRNEKQNFYRFVQAFAAAKGAEIDPNNYEEVAVLMDLTADDLEAGNYFNYIDVFSQIYGLRFQAEKLALLTELSRLHGASPEPSPHFISLTRSPQIDDLFETLADVTGTETGNTDAPDEALQQEADRFLSGRTPPYTETGEDLRRALHHDVFNRQVHRFDKMLSDLAE